MMYKHMDRYHNVDDSKIIKCYECDKILDNKSSLISHKRRHQREAQRAQLAAVANLGEATTKRQKVAVDQTESEEDEDEEVES